MIGVFEGQADHPGPSPSWWARSPLLFHRGEAQRVGQAASAWCHDGARRRRAQLSAAVRWRGHPLLACGNGQPRTSTDPYQPPWQCGGRGSSPLSSTHLSRAPNTAGPGDEDRVVDPSTTESDTARTLLDPKGASCLTRTSSSNAQHLAGQVGLSCSSSGSKQPTRGEILGVGPSGPQPFSARSAPPVGPETRSVDRLGRRAGTRCSGRRATPDADLILAYGRSPSPDACGPPRCCGPSCATSQQPQAP